MRTLFTYIMVFPRRSAFVLVALLFAGVAEALAQPGTQLRLFGKPEINGKRRLGVCLSTARSLNSARKKAADMAEQISINLEK